MPILNDVLLRSMKTKDQGASKFRFHDFPFEAENTLKSLSIGTLNTTTSQMENEGY